MLQTIRSLKNTRKYKYSILSVLVQSKIILFFFEKRRYKINNNKTNIQILLAMDMGDSSIMGGY